MATPRKATRQTLYLGKSGQLAVMAEFLARGYNVAIPEVDVGDDILVITDATGALTRVQVKSATAKESGAGYKAQFNVPVRQLVTPTDPELVYVFAVRRSSEWSDFVVLSRDRLHSYYDRGGFGSESQGGLVLTLRFRDAMVLCSKEDLSHHRSDWAKWPPVDH